MIAAAKITRNVEESIMEQEKVGRFIAELRKEKGLTQKNLAAKINVTDKAVSKWECGYCFPDNSVMQPLCDELGITINELLSGERLTSADYNKKAEENIMTLISENNNQKHSKRNFICSLIAVAVFAAYMILSLAFSTDLKIGYLIDMVSFNEVIVITLLMLVLAGRFGAFCNIFKYNVKFCDDRNKLAEAVEAASYTIKSLLLAAGISSVMGFITIMIEIDDLSLIGPNLAVMILSWFYAFVLAAVMLVLQERLKKKCD